MLSHRLRHRIAFERPIKTKNETTGETTLAWETAWLDSETELNSVPAEVLTGPGNEQQAAGAERATIAARINTRWFAGLQQDWRVVWDGAPYNIHAISTDATGRMEWRIQCTAGSNDGR